MRSDMSYTHRSWGRPDLFHTATKVPARAGESTESEYHGSRAATEHRPNRRDAYWVAEVLNVDSKAKEHVERAFRRMNALVRDHLRTETGLRLNAGDDVITVPVEIADGIPQSMGYLLDDFADIAPFLLRQPLLKTTAEGLRFLALNEPAADAVHHGFSARRGESILPPGALHQVSQYAETLVDRINDRDYLRVVLAIEHDTMGAYWLHAKRIQLYWAPIAIMASSLGVSIELLTVVVLAHELAHAYTQRGRDIDGYDWDIDAFARADNRIVEGFAQYYTRAVCRRLAQREPLLTSTFDELLKHQSEPYTAFQSWISDDSESLRGEIMRSTLLATRHARICDYDEFMPLVMQRSAQIKGGRRT